MTAAVLLGRLGREQQSERDTETGVGDFNRATVAFHDAVADGKSQPGAVGSDDPCPVHKLPRSLMAKEHLVRVGRRELNVV